MSSEIALRKLIGIKASGEEIEIILRIGVPYEEKNHLWKCPIAIEGLYDELAAIAGIDSYQALSLAIEFINNMLRHFEEKGGKLLWPTDRSSASIDTRLY